jgi:SNF2 family DNA or RNA helicase
VTDEAQEYKTPNTKVSHALKALTPRFRIACTGTPVETRLRDVWNIFDFLQPGKPLASVSEFTRQFEEPYLISVQQADAMATLNRLREKLRIGRDDAWIMRRDKRQRLPGLPAKTEHELTAPLSPEQRRMHLYVMKLAGGGGSHPFQLLHELMDVYQHPALRPRYEGISADEGIERCPKLGAVVECLAEIRQTGEKVLIFAHRKAMQQLLKVVIDHRFGLAIDIINGDRTSTDKAGARATRQQMLDRFRSYPGFSVLVLSPIVAGLGLTLVEANHVIHYGRWWNPALESQATDRIYRIGQTRPVHVYYPIAVDPSKEFTTFDEKLARIIERRWSMAEDFLAPLPAEQEIQKELLDEVLS